MTDDPKYDVLIIGGGIVGSTLACALGGSALKVAVIDREPVPEAPKPEYELRVSAITRASEQVFRSVGAWDGMVARRVSPMREMQVWDAGGDGAIHFDSADLGESHLGHIIENNVMVAALAERMTQLDNVERVAPAAIDKIEDDDLVTVILEDGRRFATRLIVGADGARSRVREHAGIQTSGWSYEQKGIVATVRTELPHRETAWQRFLPTGPLAFLPLADGTCSIVWSNDTPRADELMALDVETFTAELEQAFERRLGAVELVSERAAFPLALSHAASYIQYRLALVGDAAHTIHPLAGQGANLGIADAATLAEVVLDAHKEKRDFGQTGVLRRYERWRRSENMLMMGIMDGFKRAFGTDLAPVRILRDLGLNLTDAATPVKNLIMRRAMGLEGDLPRMARAGGT